MADLNELEPNTLRCLDRNGLTDLRSLLSLTKLQLMSLKGFGAAKSRDVRDFCSRHKLVFRPDIEPINIDFVREAVNELERIFPTDLFSEFEWNTPKTQRIINSDVASLKRNLRRIEEEHRLWTQQMDRLK